MTSYLMVADVNLSLIWGNQNAQNNENSEIKSIHFSGNKNTCFQFHWQNSMAFLFLEIMVVYGQICFFLDLYQKKKRSLTTQGIINTLVSLSS